MSGNRDIRAEALAYRPREQIAVVRENAMESFVLRSGGHGRNTIRRIRRLAVNPENKSAYRIIATNCACRRCRAQLVAISLTVISLRIRRAE